MARLASRLPGVPSSWRLPIGRAAPRAALVTLALLGAIPPPAARAQVARPPLQQAPAPLQWGSCPPSEAPASDAITCATLSVPLNHADPEGERLALTVRRSRATGPGPSLGTLVVLDGAPGAADALPLEAIARALPAALRSRLDLVSWRRRGTGRRGDPAALRCWPTEERARSWSDRQPPVCRWAPRSGPGGWRAGRSWPAPAVATRRHCFPT